MRRKTVLISSLILGLVCPAALTATNDELLPTERSNIAIFKNISPLVVNVHKLQTLVTSDFEERDVQSGMGSGFLWNQQGYIVTNFHVVAGANKIAVTLGKGRTVLAKVVGGFARKDVAVLKINDPDALKLLPNFQQFPLTDTAQLQVGQQALAIGNPFGLDRTLTTGVVSALGRQIPGYAGTLHNMVQTDASVNPGNSGGPLLDSQGRLIGMNTLIFSRSGTSAGIGFAVPANDIKRVVDQIIQYGKVKQAAIGVQIFSDDIANYLGAKGVIVSAVVANSPAAKAGLRGTLRDENGKIRLGDVIVKINGHPVSTYEDLYQILDNSGIGEEVQLQYRRDDALHDVKITTVEVQ
ncbi:MAG: trypsin-like peptidase domain-containing protein [Pseudomonadota bacterium]|nr:trypsin-like peptidase domain-containing protein [Pseudomonadota bacterium]